MCALAVLGVKEDSWKCPELYLPVLLLIIKVTRFIIVQHALKLSKLFKEEDFNYNSSYGGEGNSSQPRQPKGCLEFVGKMIDSFIVRGSRSLMQWMLDLRTYRLEVHYNTTSRGHVE